MIKKLLACWALLLFLMAANPEQDPDPYRLAPLRAAIPVDVKTEWIDCGEINGFYVPRLDTIVMCNELKTLPPGLVVAIYTHELAHAFFKQKDIPFTGSEEWAADELATYVLIEQGRGEEALEAGKWLLDNDPDDNPFNDHLSGTRRAGYILCMVMQSKDAGPDWCYVDYARISKVWKRWLDGARLPF